MQQKTIALLILTETLKYYKFKSAKANNATSNSPTLIVQHKTVLY